MSALVEHNPMADPAIGAPSGTQDEAVRRLRSGMAPVRLSFIWFGINKSLNAEQKARAAATFEADAPFVSAGKKLWDTKTPAFRAVSAVRTKIVESWRGMTLPFPEPGVRLLRRDQVEMFLNLMTDYRVELADAVAELDRHYGDLRESAARQLGDLFDPNDYPPSLTGLFDVSWDFPNCEPPGNLLAISPALYRDEQRRDPRTVRRGRPAGRGGVRRRVRPAGGPSDRAAGCRGRRLAPGLPGLGRGEPFGVLRTLPPVGRALE